MSGSGISWAICKSAPSSRQITTPAPHHSVFYRPDALPATQSTASKHWRLSTEGYLHKTEKMLELWSLCLHPLQQIMCAPVHLDLLRALGRPKEKHLGDNWSSFSYAAWIPINQPTANLNYYHHRERDAASWTSALWCQQAFKWVSPIRKQ